MNGRSERGSVHLSYSNSQKSLPRSGVRAPLSPLSRNTNRGGPQAPKESSMLRAAKSLDLESFRTSYPRDRSPPAKLNPRKLRSFRSRAFRADDQVDIFRDEKLLPPICDTSAYDSEDRFQVLNLCESQVIDSDSDTEEPDDSSDDAGEGEAGAPASASAPAPAPAPAPALDEAPVLEPATPHPYPSKITNTPEFALPPEPRSTSPRKPEMEEARPPSRHRRALSRIATIGEVPALLKTPSHTPINSPRVDQMCIFTAADARTSDILHQPSPGLDSLQNILSQLAQKERRVLEAEHVLRDAKADLILFQERLNAMMDPSHAPMTALCGPPRIINRRHHPNIGIYGLHYVQTLRPQQSGGDAAAAAAASGPLYRELNIGQESIAFRFVHSLLGLVHCIISVFPRHRTIMPQPHEYVWSPDYPSPTRFLYGLEL